MSKSFLDSHKENQARIKLKAEELGNIAKKARKAFKNVTLGAGGEESLFVLGFISGYKQKEKEL